MKTYLIISYTTHPDSNIAEEWLMDETDDRNEAIERANYWANRADKHHPVELRKVTEVIDYDDDGEPVNYDYDLVEFKNDVIYRSAGFNMKVICQRANVNYDSWRQFKRGAQGMSEDKQKALLKAMDEA